MAEFVLNTVRASLDAFTLAYIEAMFFTGIERDDYGDDTERSKELGLSDIAPDALDSIREACATFQRVNAELLEGSEPSQAGHDFWLTRNRHGAGFWDRPNGTYPNDPDGETLTDISHDYGECDPYIGDDGKVYV
jgi:hypothetical protein